MVTAGPGAGKTKVLSHRFCFILLTDDDVTLPQILTLTFTEKAAKEMEARIYAMLSQSERGLITEKDGAMNRKIREAREHFHKNNISTIHSFCAKMLRENPVESGIDPGFAVIQGAKQRQMMERAVELGISHAWQSSKDDLIVLMRALGGRKNLLIALQSVIEHPLTLERVIQTKERLFHTKDWEKKVFKDYCCFIQNHYLLPYLEGLREIRDKKGQHVELLNIIEAWGSKKQDESEFLGVPGVFHEMRILASRRKPSESRLSIIKGLREISYVDLIEEFYPDLFVDQSPDLLFRAQLDFFLGMAVHCKNIYQNEKESANGLDFADLEARSHGFLSRLHNNPNRFGISGIQKHFKYIMADEFQDTNRIQWDIIRFLCSDMDETGKLHLQKGKLFVVGDKRQAIYKFRGGDVTVFQSVIEEIIDSNPAQPTPLFLQDEMLDHHLRKMDDPYHQMMNDRRHEFDNLPHLEKEKILKGDIYLPHNFRTDTMPISFLNSAFHKIFSNKGIGALERYETAPKPIHRPVNFKKVDKKDGSVTIYLMHMKNTEGDKAESEASLIVDIIERILGRQGKDAWEYGHYADIREKIENNRMAIGILFFSYSRIKTFENVFREASLPFSIHRGRGFYRCQEVMEIIQLLKYLSDERETISLLGSLRSPIFGINDAEIFDLFQGRKVTLAHLLDSRHPYIRTVGAQIQSWRKLLNTLTLSEFIRRVISDRSLIAIHSIHPNGIQRLANLEKFIGIARQFQAEGNGSLPEFVEYCTQMSEEDEEEGEAEVMGDGDSPICFMTIHAAKGLEFPMVIIPELDYHVPFRTNPGKPVRLYSSDNMGPDAWNAEEGQIPIWPVEIPKLAFLRQKSPLGYLLLRRNRLEHIAERKRVFYVACTRTMNHLILLGNMSKRLMEKDKNQLSAEDYQERATILDLLDDHYRFAINFPPDHADITKGFEGLSWVIWRDTDPKSFKGFRYDQNRIRGEDLGVYDDQIKKIDLSDPIQSEPYLQISFHSLHLFRQCPVRFYFRVILGLNPERLNKGLGFADSSFIETTGADNPPGVDYFSDEALLIGNLIHAYLENHQFGTPLDEKQFSRVWRNCLPNDPELNGLNKERLVKIKDRALEQVQTTIQDNDLISLLEGQKDYREIPFLFRIDQTCDFKGVIDRLFKNKNTGNWSIIDWKSNDLTGKDPFKVMDENDYHLQLACYGWAVEHILGEKVGDRYIYFTDKGRLIRSQWGDDPQRIVLDMLRYIADNNNTGRQWIRQIRKRQERTGKCRSCEFARGFCK